MSLKILIRYIKNWYTKKMLIVYLSMLCGQFKFILDKTRQKAEEQQSARLNL